MTDRARAFWIVEPGRGEIREETLPVRGEGDVAVRTLYSGISRGTEALVFRGGVPASEHTRMRAPFQQGEFPGPLKYGYVSVGVVEEGPPALLNRAVFVLYPHQTRYIVPADAVHALPETLPPGRAVLASNLETAINGLWDARPHAGDRITVIGAGTVGCLVAWLAGRIPGSEVELVDVNPGRSSIARQLGVGFAEPHSVRTEADVVVHASGSPAGLELALRIAGTESTIVDLSWYGDRPVTLPLGEAFHVRRLTLMSSQVGTIPASQRARWTTRRRMQLALTLLEEPALDALITGQSRFDDLPQVMASLSTAPGDALCHRIMYG